MTAMKFAAFETSTEWCSVALWLEGEIVGLEERAGNRHSELALPMLDELLNKENLTAAGLEAVAFGAGPGSFTGLRIACGLAQGIALARGIPVMAISSLEALAEDSGGTRVIACLDARMREVYYSALEKIDGRWRERVAPQCVAPASIVFPQDGDWIGCGNGFGVYREIFSKSIPDMRPEIHPSAVAVARLAAPRLAAGEGADAALAAARPRQHAACRDHAHGQGEGRGAGVPRSAAQQPGRQGALSPLRLPAGRGARRLLPGRVGPRRRAGALAPAVSRREEILREMGLGPVWRLRVSKEDSPSVATEEKTSWQDLKVRVKNCTDCKLRAGCTQTVFGVGDEKAEWLLVGEAPGAEEDRLREPFVGQAGQAIVQQVTALRM